jgi:mRNA-degrading endonuclease toxin of MazEF toxin-antitoxin module
MNPFEIWTYLAAMPNSNKIKPRPVLIIGEDSGNNLKIVDIHYCIVSSSSLKGTYDVEIDKSTALALNLKKASIIKTTKIYTGDKSLLGTKICNLPENISAEFISSA